MSIKRYGKTYKNAEEIYNFIKDKKDVVLVSIDELEKKDQQIKQLQEQAEELINNQNRKQWQDLAVKEFADKLFDKIDNNCIVAFNSINQESFIYPEEPMMAFSNFRHHLNQLLKERGV